MELRLECLGFEYCLSSTSCLYLYESFSTAITQVLGHYLKQVNWQNSLHCRYWRHENETSWATMWWQKKQEVKIRRTTKGLGRYWAGVLLPRPSVYPKNYLFGADKHASQWPSYRPFWHKRDLGADNQEIPLADITIRCQSLRQELWCLFNFKSSLSKTIQISLIIAFSYLLVEKSINRFCYRPLNFSRFKGWQ